VAGEHGKIEGKAKGKAGGSVGCAGYVENEKIADNLRMVENGYMTTVGCRIVSIAS